MKSQKNETLLLKIILPLSTLFPGHFAFFLCFISLSLQYDIHYNAN